jgi:hypothetical protein
MMATISARRGESGTALEHLRQAVSLNPDNRSLARQDPELEPLRDHPDFRAVTEPPADPTARQAPTRPRPKPRR